MIRIGKESALGSADVIKKAVAFFGPSGRGLRVVDQGDCCARFEAAGGYVFVQTTDQEGGDGTQVSVEGREWEYQIKQFIREI
jgi:hypothetical protein